MLKSKNWGNDQRNYHFINLNPTFLELYYCVYHQQWTHEVSVTAKSHSQKERYDSLISRSHTTRDRHCVETKLADIHKCMTRPGILYLCSMQIWWGPTTLKTWNKLFDPLPFCNEFPFAGDIELCARSLITCDKHFAMVRFWESKQPFFYPVPSWWYFSLVCLENLRR